MPTPGVGFFMGIWTGAKRAVGRALQRFAPSLFIRLLLVSNNHNLEAELWYVPLLLGRRSLAVDVGANEGIWSLQLARYARVVHAFEPNPVCIGQLTKVLPSKVHLHRLGLSDKPGTAELRFDPQNTGLGTIERRNRIESNPDVEQLVAIPVRVTTLDTLGFTDVGLIKIDVEGHEEAVLAGAEETLRRERPAVVVEIEERHNPGGLRRIIALFETLDYSPVVVYEGTLQALTNVEAKHPHLIATSAGIYNFIFLHRGGAGRLAG